MRALDCVSIRSRTACTPSDRRLPFSNGFQTERKCSDMTPACGETVRRIGRDSRKVDVAGPEELQHLWFLPKLGGRKLIDQHRSAAQFLELVGKIIGRLPHTRWSAADHRQTDR